MGNLLGECIGTAVLVVFGCGVCANVSLKASKGANSGWIVVTVGWGLAVMLGVFAAISLGAPQGDINPAVTLAKFLRGGIYSSTQAIATMAAQLVGGIAGGIIVWLAYLPHWGATNDPVSKLGVFSTVPAIRSYGKNFLCEFIATFMFVFMIFAIFNANNGQLPAGIGPYLVGMLFWAIGVSLGGPTGYAVNPARDLGPRIAYTILPIEGKGSSDWDYSWVPVIGPLAGGFAAYVFAGVIGII